MRRLSGQLSTGARCRRAFLAFALILSSTPAVAQDASSTDQQRMVAIEGKLDELNEALSQTEKMLEKSRAEIQSLHSQLDELRAQTAATSLSTAASDLKDANAGQPRSEDLAAMREQQDAMQA